MKLVRSTRSTPAAEPPASIDHHDIAVRAYVMFEQEGFVHGHDIDHWLRAEKELAVAAAPEPRARRVAGGRGKK